jgi:hypothetical protein
MATEKQVEAAARALFAEGRHHSWWKPQIPKTFDELDPIGREEFLDLTWRVLRAAEEIPPD